MANVSWILRVFVAGSVLLSAPVALAEIGNAPDFTGHPKIKIQGMKRKPRSTQPEYTVKIRSPDAQTFEVNGAKGSHLISVGDSAMRAVLQKAHFQPAKVQVTASQDGKLLTVRIFGGKSDQYLDFTQQKFDGNCSAGFSFHDSSAGSSASDAPCEKDASSKAARPVESAENGGMDPSSAPPVASCGDPSACTPRD